MNHKFYTVFKLGNTFYKGGYVMAQGFGFGRKFIAGRGENFMNMDLTANQISYKGDFDHDLNLLNKLDFNYNIVMGEKWRFVAGPSINVYLTKERVDQEFGTLPVPYTIYEKEYSDMKLFSWVGLNVGFVMSL